MPTATIVVPYKPGKSGWSIMARNNFQEEVSTHIDAGNDVVFKDAGGVDAEIEQIHCSIDGFIKSRQLNHEDADAHILKFLAGGWHTHRIHKIFSVGTTAGISLNVRFVQQT